MNKKQWSDEFPTKEGLYYFYGHLYYSDNLRYKRPPKERIIKVVYFGDGTIVYITDGNFITGIENSVGFWMPCVFPDTSNLEF